MLPRNRGAGQGNGYYGEFYYMALDFTHARYYMDYPGYRYSRGPDLLVARAASLDDPSLLRDAMIAVNWLALGVATLALAAWLRRRSCSPWLALLLGLYPGLFVGVQRDLTEPLAYALVAVGVYLFDYGGRHRLFWAAAALGLAGLARQTTLVFPLCLLGSILLSGNREVPVGERMRSNIARATVFGALSIMPFVAYATSLSLWIGSVSNGAVLEWLPFEGLVASRDWELKRQGVVIAFVVIPALILAAAAILALRAGVRRVELAYLLVNVLLFVVMLERLSYGDGYTSAGRVTSGIVLAGALCIPWFPEFGGRARRAVELAMALWIVMLPVIFVYGFGGRGGLGPRARLPSGRRSCPSRRLRCCKCRSGCGSRSGYSDGLCSRPWSGCPWRNS